MTNVLTAAVLVFVTASIVLVLLLTMRRRGSSSRLREGPSAPPQPGPMEGGRRRPCPVCGALLASGERVSSIIKLSRIGERIMEISGCPQCRPPSHRRRTCPVCTAGLEPHDVLLARVFDPAREGGKPHVQVFGCTRCRAERPWGAGGAKR